MANHLLALSILVIFCCSAFCELQNEESKPCVTVEQGKVKGRLAKDYNGNNYYSFQGIPYAKAPLGDLRFKAPQPAEPWTEIFDATKEGNCCVQVDPIKLSGNASEDCLLLNVFTKELTNNGTLKPVMVWIHGGGFVSGSSTSIVFGPEFLMTEDVVIVSINYRVAVLGFLSLEDTSLGVPGNAGLKDMVMALKWVQKNIRQFNGDPDNVTIFGESAGSAACQYLMLSESAKGLFHRAILQSGVSINVWANPTTQRNAIKVAEVLGKNAKNEAEALEFLKEQPVESIIKAQQLLIYNFEIDKTNILGPVIEEENPEAFLTEHPIDLMLTGKYIKVPIIIGYTNNEGMIFELLSKSNNITIFYRYKNFEEAIPSYYNITSGTELSRTIAKKIEEFYYGDSKTAEEDVNRKFLLDSDAHFVRGIHVSIRAMLKTSNKPIYFYKFNIETSLNLGKILGNIQRSGVSHGDDIGYMFKGQFTPNIEAGSQEDVAIRRVVKLWTNFAKNGNPNPKEKDALIDVEWPQVTSENFQYLNIDKKYSVSSNPEEKRMKFWDEISALDGVKSKY